MSRRVLYRDIVIRRHCKHFPWARPFALAASGEAQLAAHMAGSYRAAVIGRSGSAGIDRNAGSYAAALAALTAARAKANAAAGYAATLSVRAAAMTRGGLGSGLLQLLSRGLAIARAAPGIAYAAPITAGGLAALRAGAALRTGTIALLARALGRFVAFSPLFVRPSPMAPLIEDPTTASGLRQRGPGGTLSLAGPPAGTHVKATDAGPLKS